MLVEASERIQEIKDRTFQQIFQELRSRVRDHPTPGTNEISELDFYKQAKRIYEESERQIAQIEAPFTVEVIDLKGEGNYYKVWKEIDAQGLPVVRIEVTTLDGRPKPIVSSQKRISPSVANKGQYNTFTESHFHEVPWIVLKEILY